MSHRLQKKGSDASINQLINQPINPSIYLSISHRLLECICWKLMEAMYLVLVYTLSPSPDAF